MVPLLTSLARPRPVHWPNRIATGRTKVAQDKHEASTWRELLFRTVSPLLLVWLLGCEAQTVEVPAVTAWEDSAGLTIASSDPERAPACSLAAEPRIVVGTASGRAEQELFGVYGAATLSSGEIVVINHGSMEVRIYDAEGQFVRSFGRRGGGPGEFESMLGIWVLPGDTVWIGDRRPWRYQVYTADGEWVRTLQPRPALPNPPIVRGLLRDGRPVLGDQLPHRADRTFPQTWLEVSLYDLDGVLVDTLGRFSYGRWGRPIDDPRSLVVYPFFESRTSVAAGGDRIAVGPGDDPRIVVFEVPGNLPVDWSPIESPNLVLKWRTEDLKVTAADVEAEKDRIRDLYADRPARVRQLSHARLHEDRPAAATFPTHGDLLFGTDGSLWVTEYTKPWDDSQRHLIFESGGELRCRLTTPRDHELYEVGSDYVLAKRRDDLGVEYVVLLDLLGPHTDTPIDGPS